MRGATPIETIAQTVQQRAQGGSPSCQRESPLSQEREIEIQMEQLSSHTTSKIWSTSSADVSVESRQAESKMEGAEQVAARLKGVSNQALLEGQSHKALKERLKVLKTAWVFGNGEMPQRWCSIKDRKKDLIAHIHSAIAAFAAVPAVKLPVGLQEAIMAKDFNFGNCLARFGLDETKANVICNSRLRHQNISHTECRFHTISGKRRRLSMANVTHNKLPQMNYTIDDVHTWLTKFPIFLQLKSSSTTFSDNCRIELQDELSKQTHSMSIKDLNRLSAYHQIASGMEEQRLIRNYFYIGTLLTRDDDHFKPDDLLRFFRNCSHSSSQDPTALPFKLADFMHVPDNQAQPSGNWLIVFKSGKLMVRRGTSYTAIFKASKYQASRFKGQPNKPILETQNFKAHLTQHLSESCPGLGKTNKVECIHCLSRVNKRMLSQHMETKKCKKARGLYA